MASKIDLNDLYDIHQLSAEFPTFLKVSTLRNQLRNRQNNGLHIACIKIGKKLLISKQRYQSWINNRLNMQ